MPLSFNPAPGWPPPPTPVDRSVARPAAVDARTAALSPAEARRTEAVTAHEVERVEDLVRHVTAVVAENHEA